MQLRVEEVEVSAYKEKKLEQIKICGSGTSNTEAADFLVQRYTIWAGGCSQKQRGVLQHSLSFRMAVFLKATHPECFLVSSY